MIFRRLKSERGQSATEYVLAISVVVIGMAGVFYELVNKGGQAPIKTAFEYQRNVIEAPYP